MDSGQLLAVGDQPSAVREKAEEFRLQFNPTFLLSGSSRVNEGNRRKHYVAVFAVKNALVHESRVQHKTATDARKYAKNVLDRYQRAARLALAEFIERHR